MFISLMFFAVDVPVCPKQPRKNEQLHIPHNQIVAVLSFFSAGHHFVCV